MSILVWLPEPKRPDALTSTRNITVSSRSSTKRLTKGAPMRAVTFQSMERTSSPGWYSRTSSNSIPCPLKTLWYSPEKTSLTRRRVVISMRRTFLRTSATLRSDVSVADGLRSASRMGSGNLDVVEDSLQHRFRIQLLGLRLVGEDDAVAQHVEGDRLHVLRGHVAAAAQEGVGRATPGRGRWWRAARRRSR